MSRRESPILSLCCRFVARRIAMGEASTSEMSGAYLLIEYLTRTPVKTVIAKVERIVQQIRDHEE